MVNGTAKAGIKYQKKLSNYTYIHMYKHRHWITTERGRSQVPSTAGNNVNLFPSVLPLTPMSVPTIKVRVNQKVGCD